MTGRSKPAPLVTTQPHRFQAFDLLATLVLVVRSDGMVLFANAALEDALGTSRRTIEGSFFPDSFTEPERLLNALHGAGSNEFAALRYDAWLKRVTHDPLPWTGGLDGLLRLRADGDWQADRLDGRDAA